MNQKLKVVHIWGDFFPGLFASPHQYLLDKSEWETVTFAHTLVRNKNFLVRNFYSLSEKEFDQLYSEGFWGKLILKLRENSFWKKYNNWIGNHPGFKNACIIHAHFGNMGIRILPVVKKYKLPLVVSFYGVDGSRLLKEKKWIQKFQTMFCHTSVAIVLCEEVRNRLIELGLPDEKILVWRIPIELNTYQYQPRVKSSSVNFIIAARFVEKKGYPYLLEAFERMIRDGKDVRLTIIGYGSDKPKVEEEVSRRNLNAYTNLIDTKLENNFPQVYYRELQESHIFVLPSTTSKEGDDEGGPALTLVAAQAAGLPVICTPFPGAEMSVFENQTGLFCQFNNVDSLHKKMDYLYNNPREWDRLGKAASQYVHKAFATESQMEEVLSQYKNIVQ